MVNTTTGEILVVNGSQLDWGVRPIYYATLQAKDGGGLTGSTQLEITVVDINNNAPVVIGSYNAFVTEGKDIVHIHIQVKPKHHFPLGLWIVVVLKPGFWALSRSNSAWFIERASNSQHMFSKLFPWDFRNPLPARYCLAIYCLIPNQITCSVWRGGFSLAVC